MAATIHVQALMSNPPQPTGFMVNNEYGTTVAILHWEDVKRAYEQYAAMEARLKEEKAARR